jgi:hypothetical protein
MEEEVAFTVGTYLREVPRHDGAVGENEESEAPPILTAASLLPLDASRR